MQPSSIRSSERNPEWLRGGQSCHWPQRGSRAMLMTGPQHSSPEPPNPLSVQVFRLKPARVSWPAIIMMSHRNVKPHVSINEVACYRTERTLMGCADPLEGGSAHPHQCSRVNKNRTGWGELSLACVRSVAFHATSITLHCIAGESNG